MHLPRSVLRLQFRVSVILLIHATWLALLNIAEFINLTSGEEYRLWRHSLRHILSHRSENSPLILRIYHRCWCKFIKLTALLSYKIHALFGNWTITARYNHFRSVLCSTPSGILRQSTLLPVQELVQYSQNNTCSMASISHCKILTKRYSRAHINAKLTLNSEVKYDFCSRPWTSESRVRCFGSRWVHNRSHEAISIK
jgi:hypothetical protein